jgi:hypothetical protein
VGILGWAFSGYLLAQNAPAERTFHTSKENVEKTLRDMHAYAGGKLPILEGFVAPAEHALDRYTLGYYQYSLDLSSVSSDQTRVGVTAKITAWYTGDSSSHSGYQVLTSNGRLESDLLDRLAETLKEPMASGPAASAGQKSNLASSMPDAPVPVPPPSLSASAGIHVPPVSNPSLPKDSARERLIQELTEKAKALEEVLHSQARPSDLAAVKAARTPVLASPVDGAKVLFLADAEDEFQVIDTNESWVHIQISGISRGWVRRSQVDLPGALAGNPSETPADAERADKDAFRRIREETSLFPGKWDALAGKKVRIIWVQPSESKTFGERSKLGFAKSVFRTVYPELSQTGPEVAGVVIVFDSEDGGMAAVTAATLQQWGAGHMTDDAFWKRCWLDPADAFKLKN